MNTVTFETAKSLQDAGFPQPRPAEGQFWYAPSGVLFLMFHVATNGNYELQEIGRDITSIGRHWREWVFAPQAHDILAQLPGYNLAFATETGWHCFFMDIRGIVIDNFEDKNSPHEAAAKAYLQLHKPA